MSTVSERIAETIATHLELDQIAKDNLFEGAIHPTELAQAIVDALGIREEWSIVFDHGNRQSSRGVYKERPEDWRDTNERLEVHFVTEWEPA